MYPILFEIGNITIQTYFVLLCIGIFSGFLVLYINIKNLKLEMKKNIFLFAVIIFIPFVFGAKIGIKIENFLIKNFFLFPEIIYGSSLIWGFIFATLFAFPIANYLKLNVWETGDYFASSIAIGGFFVRLGCLFNGCCFGIPVSENFPFSVFFPCGSHAYRIFNDTPLHPVQLYLSLVWLFIFVFLAFYKSVKKFNGELIILLLILFSALNFFVDFFRFHPGKQFFFISQILNVFILLLSILLYIHKHKN